MKSIKASQIKPGCNLIDIRSKNLYARGHIYNARNIDYNNLIDMPHMYLNKLDTYFIYCSEGLKSRRCCKMLEIQGYNVVNIEDGYEGYKKLTNSL